MHVLRTRWAAIGAAIAVTVGAGGISLVSATEPADALTLVSITPCRVADTRPAPFTVGDKSSALGAAEVHTIDAHGDNGNCVGIPASAKALSLNVTATDASLPTFLTIWTAGETRPVASSLNPVPGAPPTPNAVTTGLNADGEFSIFNLQGAVNAIVDINGYYVDHHHDDRYYSKADADARFLRPGQAAAAPTTQTRWAGCNGPSMNAANDDDNTFIVNNNSRGYAGSLTSGTRWYCQLDLPQGAQMTRFRALLRDVGPSGSGQGLSRCLLYLMPVTGPSAGDELIIVSTAVGTGSTGTAGAETPILLEDPMGSVTVDNTSNVYFIKCDIFARGSTTANQLGIYAAQVRYNIPTVPGTG